MGRNLLGKKVLFFLGVIGGARVMRPGTIVSDNGGSVNLHVQLDGSNDADSYFDYVNPDDMTSGRQKAYIPKEAFMLAWVTSITLVDECPSLGQCILDEDQ